MSNTADTYSPTIPLIPGDRSDTEPANQQPENSAPAFWLAGRSRASSMLLKNTHNH